MYQTLTSLEPPLPCRFALAPWRPGAGRFGRKNRARPPPLGPSGGPSRSSKRLSWRTPHPARCAPPRRRRLHLDALVLLVLPSRVRDGPSEWGGGGAGTFPLIRNLF